MLNRKTRTRILAESPRELALELAAGIGAESEVEAVEPPRQGLVMCQVRETARGTRFYLGEALMTECRVRVDGAEGLGAVLGADEERARAMAIVDAVYNGSSGTTASGTPARLDEVERRLREADDELREHRRVEERRIMLSRVSFDTMGGQDMTVQAVAR